MLKSYFKKFFYSCLESMPLWSVIFLLNPTIISIKSHKYLDYHDSILMFGISFILISLTTGLFISIFPKKYYKIPVSFIRSLFIITFLISIFYPAAGGLQDGTSTTLPSLKYLITFYGVCLLGVVFLVILFLRKIKLLRNFYVILSIVGFGTISYYYITFTSTFSPKTLGKPYYQADLSFGSDRNIIFIVADMLQGSMLEQFFHMNPDEKKYFDGFAFYSRAISPFPCTTYSLPAMLTGNLYGNKDFPKSHVNYALNACLTSSLITDAINKGFDSTSIGISSLKLSNNHFYYREIRRINVVFNLLNLSLKRIIKFSVIESIPKKILPKVYGPIVSRKIDSCKVMRRLYSEKIGDKKNKLIVFHSLVPHVPVMFTKKDLNNNLYYLNKPLPWNLDNLFEEIEFFACEVKALIHHMKSIGVYDKSLIIIAADHGHVYSDDKNLLDYLGAEDFKFWETTFSCRPVGMYNPAILIKPPFTKGLLQINRAPSTTLNLRRVVKNYLRGNTNKLDLFKEFENIDMQKVILLKHHTHKNNLFDYFNADNHIILEFEGNISKLRSNFTQKILSDHLNFYKMSEKIKPFVDKHLMDGKWLVNKTGSWLTKDPGIVYIKNSTIKKNKNYKLRVEVSGLVKRGIHPAQKVNLALNGIKFGEIMLTKPGKHNLEINIPSEFMSNSKVNVMEFQPLNAIAPVTLGLSKNTEPLSIYLYSFQIVESN